MLQCPSLIVSPDLGLFSGSIPKCSTKLLTSAARLRWFIGKLYEFVVINMDICVYIYICIYIYVYIYIYRYIYIYTHGLKQQKWWYSLDSDSCFHHCRGFSDFPPQWTSRSQSRWRRQRVLPAFGGPQWHAPGQSWPSAILPGSLGKPPVGGGVEQWLQDLGEWSVGKSSKWWMVDEFGASLVVSHSYGKSLSKR